MNRASLLGVIATAVLATAACKSSPAPPFDQLKSANVTAFRLQNYEPPAPPPGQATGPMGLPPEISNWMKTGAQGLQQLLPPGLLPPGMLNAPDRKSTRLNSSHFPTRRSSDLRARRRRHSIS